MTSNMIIQDKEIAVPGEGIASGMDFLPGQGTFRDKDQIIASRVGIVNVEGRLIKLIPLSGKYLPKSGDTVVGKVIDITINGWRMDINSAYTAMLSIKDATSSFIKRGADLTKFFTFNDYVSAKIINVTSQNLVDLTMRGIGLRRLEGGRAVNVNPTKVPRIIGKQGSMVTMIKEATKCNIIVGQNGVVWVQGEPRNEILAVRTIRKIEEESHISGLTEKIKKFLEENAT